jgi:hypothetical protein
MAAFKVEIFSCVCNLVCNFFYSFILLCERQNIDTKLSLLLSLNEMLTDDVGLRNFEPECCRIFFPHHSHSFDVTVICVMC